MTAGLPRRLGVVGLGLMGASLARAARAALPELRVIAVEPRDDVRAMALADGVADVAVAAPGPELADCELAILCTPIASLEALLGPVSRLLPDGAVLSDVGGAKERVVARAAAEVRPGVAFVGAHPMFGGHGGCRGLAPAVPPGERARAGGARGGPARRGAGRSGAARHDAPRAVPLRHPGRGVAPERPAPRGGRAPLPSPRAVARRSRRLARGGARRAGGGPGLQTNALPRRGGGAVKGPVVCRRYGPLRGAFEVPGDKSVSHRALLFSALATSPSKVRGLLAAEDVGATRRAVEALGATVRDEGAFVVVEPPERLSEPGDVVDCGNSGTSLRLLCGVLAAIPGLSVLTGDA